MSHLQGGVTVLLQLVGDASSGVAVFQTSQLLGLACVSNVPVSATNNLSALLLRDTGGLASLPHSTAVLRRRL